MAKDRGTVPHPLHCPSSSPSVSSPWWHTNYTITTAIITVSYHHHCPCPCPAVYPPPLTPRMTLGKGREALSCYTRTHTHTHTHTQCKSQKPILHTTHTVHHASHHTTHTMQTTPPMHTTHPMHGDEYLRLKVCGPHPFGQPADTIGRIQMLWLSAGPFQTVAAPAFIANAASAKPLEKRCTKSKPQLIDPLELPTTEAW